MATREQFVRGEIGRLKSQLLLDAWDIDFKLLPIKSVDCSCEVLDYGLKRALVKLPLRGTRDSLIEDLRHEALHLVLWPENRVFDAVAEEQVEDAKARAAFYELYNRGQNQVIGHLLRIFRKAGL